MAQLFTVYFPKYCFEVQEEFSITFPDATKLPIELDVSEKGIFITDIHFDGTSDLAIFDERLKKGLRVVSINNDNLAYEDDIGIFMTDKQKPLTLQDVNKKIKHNGESSIEFTFREDIPIFDDSNSLGLQYNSENKYLKIKDDQISVSSYENKYIPEHIRLNTPNSHWSPSYMNEKSRDVWVCIDLGSKKVVDTIQIQGSQNHKYYVKEFWIEYSDDLCEWKSHPMRVIKCRYIKGKSKPINNNNNTTTLQTIESNAAMTPLTDATELKDEETSILLDATGNINKWLYATSEIKIWPVIHAQFIKIRPWKWENHIAMRIDLFGSDRLIDNPKYQQVGQIVTANTVCPQFKQQLQIALIGKDNDTKCIQIDCKAIISKAMDLAGCTTYSIINVDENSYLLILTTANSSTSERVMDSLTDVGVGRQLGVISATPIDWRNASKYIEEQVIENKAKSTGFYKSIQSHKAVQVVIERIMNSALLTFDYFCMLTIASLIAVGGLATDSSVIVVASMLVSPIMGPVLAFTFGVTLGNWSMAKVGFRNECFSLFICLLVGFIVGFFYALGTKNRNCWPTSQMSERGDPWSLSDGAFIAAASGVGVALSVLGDYLSTVVGVAISASLLPPAVNCGMLLSFCIYKDLPNSVQNENCLQEHNTKDLLISAIISFVLTIENIFIIFLSATIMFRIKDIVKIQDRNYKKMWDNISKFRHEFKLHRKAAAGAAFTHLSQARNMSENDEYKHDNDDYVSVPQIRKHSSIHGNYEMDIDVYTSQKDRRARKAIHDVKQVIYESEADIMHSTLKGQVFRQFSQYLFTENDNIDENKNNIFQTDEKHNNTERKDGDESDTSNDTLPKESENKPRPGIDTIFKVQSEDKPLLSNDNIVQNDVVDEND